MVQLVAHGGQCCGARHIHGFYNSDAADASELERVVKEAPAGRMLEVILNGTQCRDKPLLLQKLASLGFVLTNHWINNNHQSDCYQFTRCDRRRPMVDLPFLWPGQTITPATQGEIQLNGSVRYTGPAPRPGVTHFRINSPASKRHGQEFTLVRSSVSEWGTTLYHFNDGVEFSIARNNCIRLDFPEQPDAPNPNPNLHNQPDLVAGQVVNYQVVPAPVTVMTSFYHNVYKSTGRSEYAHATIDSARRASAKGVPIRTDRHDLMTDGTDLWVEGVGE